MFESLEQIKNVWSLILAVKKCVKAILKYILLHCFVNIFSRYDEIVKVFMIPLGREQIKKKIKKKRDLQEKKCFSKNGNKLQFQ